jgi:hypothetical protein
LTSKLLHELLSAETNFFLDGLLTLAPMMFPAWPEVNIMWGSFGWEENIVRAKKALVSSRDMT